MFAFISRHHRPCLLATVLALDVFGVALGRPSGLPDNLARKATIEANSTFSKDYLGRFVADGKIPCAGGSQDVGEAWCVNGNTHRDGAELTLQWPEPVTVAEFIYYARTAWFMNETWKDYEVYGDEDPVPFLRGRLAMVHGPQRRESREAARFSRLSSTALSPCF